MATKPSPAALAGIKRRAIAKGLNPTRADILATWRRGVARRAKARPPGLIKKGPAATGGSRGARPPGLIKPGPATQGVTGRPSMPPGFGKLQGNGAGPVQSSGPRRRPISGPDLPAQGTRKPYPTTRPKPLPVQPMPRKKTTVRTVR